MQDAGCSQNCSLQIAQRFCPCLTYHRGKVSLTLLHNVLSQRTVILTRVWKIPVAVFINAVKWKMNQQNLKSRYESNLIMSSLLESNEQTYRVSHYIENNHFPKTARSSKQLQKGICYQSYNTVHQLLVRSSPDTQQASLLCSLRKH